MIDAVFSIGVKYTSTTNVVRSYCAYYGLRVHNESHDQEGDKHTISQLIGHITSTGVEESADVIFKNHQRTSTRNGILKAEAVLRFASVLQKYGVETLADMSAKGLPLQAEQGAQDSLTEAVKILRGKYPQLSVRLLNYSIWNYMSYRGQEKSAKKYHKLARDRIPEIIEVSGMNCTCQTLSDKGCIRLLDEKLNEKLAEYQERKFLEELTDLLEVIRAVVKARGWTMEELEQVRESKGAEHGGVDNRILLKK